VTPNTSRGVARRSLLTAASLLIVIAACGRSTSTAGYVDGLNELVATAAPDLQASLADYEQIADPTMADWVTFVDREIAIRRVFDEGFDALDPPDSISEVHQILGDALDRGLIATERLAAVADTVSSPAEAEQTPEFAEYQAANSDGSTRVCRDAQAKLDEIAESRETFSDTPWSPTELTRTVRALLGCDEIESG
jgi:hypothetical protein